MIDPGMIQELLDREPFQMFRITMTDGNTYEVVNPQLAVPMQEVLFVAMPKRDKFKLLSYQNMTSVEANVAA